MTADRVTHLIAAYEAGALTESDACLEILLAAGAGSADAVFARLPSELRAAVIRAVEGANADKARILESYCGSEPPSVYEAELRRRDDVARRGIVAIRRVIAGRAGLT